MSGLRFDNQRTTNLYKTFTSSGNQTKWTWSGWVKNTYSGSNRTFFSAGKSSGDRAQLMFDQPSPTPIRFFDLASSTSLITTAGYTSLKWIHIVLAVDTTQATESNRVKLYVDGELITALSANYPSQNAALAINADSLHTLGKGYSVNESFDGYLSDVYFVDGQALEPSVFGKDYSGLWGPLPSDTVKNNISRNESPYDQRPNMDEEWSAAVSLSGTDGWAQGPELAFDGVVSATDNSTSYVTNGRSGTVVTMSFNTPVTINNKIEIFLTDSALANDSTVGYKFELDGAERLIESSDGPGWGKGWIDLGDSFVGKTIANTTPLIQSVSKGSPQVWLSAIRVDGRILIDGPANNSQNWSDGLKYTDGTSVQNPANAFNGDPANGAGGDNKEITWTVPIGTLSGTIETYSVKTSGESTTNLVKLFDSNGNLITSSDSAESGGGYTQTFPDVTGVKKITIYQKGSGLQVTGLHYIKLDNKFLVDGGAQWDTSQVWSSMYTGGPGRDLMNAFDGNDATSNIVGSSAGHGEITWSLTPLPVGAKVKIKAYCGTNAGDILANGLSVKGNSANYETKVFDCGTLSSDTLTISQRVNATPGIDSDDNAIYYVEVDGKLLVDTGSFGTNGFYLPFDPAATGQRYSQYLSSDSGQYRNGNTPEKAFNGDSTSICESATEGTSSQIIFDPPNDLFTGEINIKLGAPVNISAVAIDGGGGSNTLTSTTTNVWEGTITGLQSITLTITVPNGYCDLRFLEINGKVLVDHNNIGVDASGINNHFYDENFITGDRVTIAGEDWASYGIGQATQSGGSSSGWEAMFDGDTTEGALPDGARAITWDYTAQGGLTGTTLALYGYKNGTPGKLEVNGVDVTAEFPNHNGIGTNQRTVITSFNGTLNTITLTRPDGGASGPVVSGVEIDNALLINNKTVVSTAPDTVLDTPVKNYAVFDQASTNGNLDKTASSTRAYSTIELSNKQLL